MPWNELLYERKLKKPFDAPMRQALDSEYQRRRHEIPIPTEIRWHASESKFTIRSSMLSFHVHFTPDHRLVVNAELSLAAKLLATPQNRQDAVRFIESIASDVGL
jgi:hypothetical protein